MFLVQEAGAIGPANWAEKWEVSLGEAGRVLGCQFRHLYRCTVGGGQLEPSESTGQTRRRCTMFDRHRFRQAGQAPSHIDTPHPPLSQAASNSARL